MSKEWTLKLFNQGQEKRVNKIDIKIHKML